MSPPEADKYDVPGITGILGRESPADRENKGKENLSLRGAVALVCPARNGINKSAY